MYTVAVAVTHGQKTLQEATHPYKDITSSYTHHQEMSQAEYTPSKDLTSNNPSQDSEMLQAVTNRQKTLQVPT